MKRTRGSKAVQQRRGMISMELILALPILFLLLIGLFEFSFLMSARADVVHACREGARLAALPGVVEEDVDTEVGRALGGRFGGRYRVEAEMGEHSGDEVLVTVRVPMTAAAPNLLWPVGYNTQGRDLIAQARVAKE